MQFSLPSLVYHDREWFVFQDVVSHLPKEKASLASKRSKESRRYTSRLGISKDWVIGERKVKLVKHGFIQDQEFDSTLIFSNVLIVREHFEQLLRESFNRSLTLKVEQFTLTEKLFTIVLYEWHFDPQQNDSITKTKIEPKDESIPQTDKKVPKEENVASKVTVTCNGTEYTKIAGHKELRSTPLKRRRSSLSKRKDSNSEDSGTEWSDRSFSSSAGEILSLRPKRKKAKEATDKISLMAQNETNDNRDDINHDGVETKIKHETTPPKNSPRKIHLRKSPIQVNKTSPSQEDTKHMEISNGTLPNEPSPETALEPVSHEEPKAKVEDDDTEIPLPLPLLFDDLDNGDCLPISPAACEKVEQDNSETIRTDSPSVEPVAIENNNSPTIPLSPECNSDIPEPTQANVNLTNGTDVLNSSTADVLHSSTANVSPSALVENIENIRQQQQQLCSEEQNMDTETLPTTNPNDDGGTAHSSGVGELESPSRNGNVENANDHIDHDANCTTSIVCLCAGPNTSVEAAKKVNSAGATDLLDGLIATGFVSHVRQMLENINSDKETKVSQMDQEIKTLQIKIRQQKKSNQQLQLNIKKKARELEKLFETLRKGNAECEKLEEKCEALKSEKAAVDAKLKKCLEVLNSID